MIILLISRHLHPKEPASVFYAAIIELLVEFALFSILTTLARYYVNL